MLLLATVVLAIALLLTYFAAVNAFAKGLHPAEALKGHFYTNSVLAAIFWGAFYYLTHLPQ